MRRGFFRYIREDLVLARSLRLSDGGGSATGDAVKAAGPGAEQH